MARIKLTRSKNMPKHTEENQGTLENKHHNPEGTYERKKEEDAREESITPMQTVLFDASAFPANTKEYLNIRTVKHIVIPQADEHVLAINLRTPHLLNKVYENIKLSRQVVETPEGRKVEVDLYHADGGSKDTQRNAEHKILKAINDEWIAGQEAKLAVTGDGSGDLLRQGDYNISVVEWDSKKGCLKWNDKFFKMLKTAYPQGIYGLSLPNEVLFKIRGLGTGISRKNNQTLKDDQEVWCAKNIIVHLRTNKEGKPIDNTSEAIEDLQKKDPNSIFTRKSFQETTTFKDHTDAVYKLFKTLWRAGANMGNTGSKELHDARKKFKKEALTEKGGIKHEVNTASQQCFKEAARLIIKHLNLEIVLNPNPASTVIAEDSGKITEAINKLLEKGDRELVTVAIKEAVSAWFLGEQYNNYTRYFSEPPKTKRYVDSINSWQFEAIEESVDGLADKVMLSSKDYLGAFVKFLNTEDCGGYSFPNHGHLDGKTVDEAQAKATVENALNAMQGKVESTLVLGGDDQEGPVEALWYAESESSLLSDVCCYTLSLDKKPAEFQGPDSAWVRSLVLSDTQRSESDFIIRFNNELYYVCKFIDENHKMDARIVSIEPSKFKKAVSLEKRKDNEKIYNNFLKRFTTAEKDNKSFYLDLVKDSDALETLANMGICLKASKEGTFHQAIHEAFQLALQSIMTITLAPARYLAGFFAHPSKVNKEEVNTVTSSITLD